nr:hypothetical protein [Tanacetum cinerariifolium]
MNQNFSYSNSFGFDQIQPPQQFVNHQPQEIPEVIPSIKSKEWIETKNELYKMMEAYTERMNPQPQREPELLARKQVTQEKEEPPQNSDFRQLIGEMCGIKVSVEQKQKLEEMIDDKSLSNDDIPMENFKIYSNPLFDDEEIISTKIDPHYFNVESNLFESLLNRDTFIDSSPKFDYLLEEFSGELAHIDPIPSRIEEADFDLEEEIRLVENLSYDNSSPPEEFNAEIADMILESLSLHFLSTNDTLPLPKNESSNFDHHDDPSFTRPPPEPPDVKVFFDFEPDTGVLTTKVVKGISEHYVLMPNILNTIPTLDLDLDFTPSHDSLESGNKIFDPRIFIEVQSERLLSREEFSISFIRDPLYPMFDTCSRFHLNARTKCSNLAIMTFNDNLLRLNHLDENLGYLVSSSQGWLVEDLDNYHFLRDTLQFSVSHAEDAVDNR